jgi:hypothetical protein
MMIHQRALRDADVLVSKGLPPARHRRLRNHLRGCEECQRHYERLRAVEDALTPAHVMSDAAIERLGELVLDDVAPRPKPESVGWLAVLGTATALAVAALVVMPRQSTDELVARGGRVQVADHGLHVFVIDPGSKTVTRAQPAADRRVVVDAGRLIQLAYSNGSYRYGVVIGVDAAYATQWYHPSEGERASGGVRLERGAVDEPFPGSWSIENTTLLRMFAVFSDAPIDFETITAAVARLRESGRPISSADRLPGAGDAQDTLLIEVAKR